MIGLLLRLSFWKQVIEVSTLKDAQQIIERINTWVGMMKEYCERCNIDRFHDDYVDEIKLYNEVDNQLKYEFLKVHEFEDMIKYAEIRVIGFNNFKELKGEQHYEKK